MSQQFTWVPDLTRGEWLRPLEEEPFGSILSIVPRGFEAYARVFHPIDRDRPRATKTWQGVDEMTYAYEVDDIGASLETEGTTWAAAAVSFGTIMHAEAQYARLVRHNDHSGSISADGWRYGDTSIGSLDPVSLSTLSAVLACHTGTPEGGIAAIWEGWGGLVSGTSARYVSFGSDDAPSDLDIQRALDSLSGRNGQDPEPGTGILQLDAAVGPRFDLHGDTGRSYILFEVGVADLADAAWPDRAPWVDEVMWAQSPSILWPDDHSWVLATEIDFDSTLIAGTRDLISELLRTEGLEVLPITTDADLTWGGDTLNRE